MAIIVQCVGKTLMLYLDVPPEARRGVPSGVTLPIREALDIFEEIAASGAIRPADRTKLGASGGIDTIVSKFRAPGGLADCPKLPAFGGPFTTAFKLDEMD